ncbi:ankyrin repeat domain-containing protein [Wolbachia endosymbiont (group A) of Anomoia purmunda]|uniref:ankyrin repeat domain-containing protein n=1 Tax=Wolbachia endosymbiont (group A) of Anomoia purmunda TaxID=2953978 RepID=UPI00223277AC|nr:ankyrin repeat domain-containing protein [Wolbachia endosymbiont (group A) of Anomoia purmunda]
MCNIIEKYLVDKKDVKNDEGNTPLHLAVEEGNLETVKHLVEKGAGINAVNRYGYTPLYIAAYKGSTDIAVYLVEKGANASDNILHEASNLDIVRHFIAKGANINATKENGETFLHIAAIDGKLEIVQYLVEEKNFNINAANIKGNTVLHHAAHGGCEKTARYLVEKGANVKATNRHGITPLHIAAFCGYSYVVENLIEDGADKNAISSNGCTLAHYAAIGDESGMSCVLEYLVEEEGINFNVTDNLGSTPLHWAAYWRNNEVVEYLVEKQNVDINVTDNEGRTPLHWAAYHAKIDLVKYFIERGAEIKATKKYGNTPLHYALNGRWKDNYLEVVEYMAGTRKLTIPENVENVEKDSLDIIKYDFY